MSPLATLSSFIQTMGEEVARATVSTDTAVVREGSTVAHRQLFGASWRHGHIPAFPARDSRGILARSVGEAAELPVCDMLCSGRGVVVDWGDTFPAWFHE